MAFNTFPEVSFRISFPLMVLAEPVNPSFLRSYIPVTTTSSISVTCSFKVTFKNLFTPKVTRWGSKPIKLNTNTPSFNFKDNSNSPLESVEPPKLVLSKRIVTPGNGSPLISTTLPLTTFTKPSSLFCCGRITMFFSITSYENFPCNTSFNTDSTSIFCADKCTIRLASNTSLL